MVDVQPPAKDIKRNRLDKNDMIAVTTKKELYQFPPTIARSVHLLCYEPVSVSCALHGNVTQQNGSKVSNK